MNNPYLQEEKWYWFTEDYIEYGPYDTKEEAEKDLREYVRIYL